jgi:transcriptional regulator with XRE-family HTH domain
MGLSKEELCKRVGLRLRELRLDKGLTIEKLAHESGIEYTQISRIELGKINTSIYQIYHITITLDVPMRDVFIIQ